MSESESPLPLPLSQIALIGVGAILIGAFLPWVTTGVGARVGISSLNGILTLLTGGIVGAYTLSKKLSQRVILSGGGLCSAIGAYNTVFPLSIELLGTEVMSGFRIPAIGVFLTLFGGLILLGVGVIQSQQ